MSKVIETDDYRAEGEFDSNDVIVKGTVVHKEEGTLEGDFVNGHLVAGKRTENDGNIWEGSFSSEDQSLIKGKKTDLNGFVMEGEFSGGNITAGKVTTPDGVVAEGTFCAETGSIVTGTITYPDGEVRTV